MNPPSTNRPTSGHRTLHLLTLALSLVAVMVLLIPMRQHEGLQLLFNLAHVPGFALIALCWAENLLARGWSRRRRLLTMAVVALLMAAATEALQAHVPGRYADLGDMARNALGIALGLGLHARWPGLLASRFERD